MTHHEGESLPHCFTLFVWQPRLRLDLATNARSPPTFGHTLGGQTRNVCWQFKIRLWRAWH